MSYPYRDRGWLSIISVLAPGKDAPVFLRATRIVGSVSTTLLLLEFIVAQFGVTLPSLIDTLLGWNILVFFACIAVLGFYALAKSQKITVNRTVWRLLLYIFIPAIILTAILITLGYIFRWPGVVGK